MSGVIGNPQTGNGVPGNVWNTNSQGIASPQAVRPAMTGGLQPLAMLQAYRSGASMDQLQAMNPYTARPAQFLPQALPTQTYISAPVQPIAHSPFFNPDALPSVYMGGNGPGGGVGVGGSGGNAAAASSDSGQDGSSAAVGGGDGGGGGGGSK